MRSRNTSAVLFNLSGGAILLTVAAYMGYAFFHTSETSPCSRRYPAGMQFALNNDAGDLLTPIELQGRAGSREWGVLKNALIVASPGGPSDASMQVSLATTGDEEDPNRNGVGFTWQSHELRKAASGCLSYSVFLPETFAFAAPGYLPGLYSASDTAELDARTPSDGFAARVGWQQGGEVGIDVRSTGTENFWLGSHTAAVWPRGRWVPVEQEVNLGTATGRGAVRLWVDGRLQLENTSANLRSQASPGFSGVVADIGYSRSPADPASVEVSPFVVRWQ